MMALLLLQIVLVSATSELFTANKILNGISDGAGNIRWNHTTDEMKKITDETLAYCEETISKIEEVPDSERTFDNTIVPFAELEANAVTVASVFRIGHGSTEELLAAQKDSLLRFEDFERNFSLDVRVFKAISEFKKTAKKNEEWSKLTKEDHIFVNKVLIGYMRAGIWLSDHVTDQLKQLDEETLAL